jgi:hypothetical protein
MRGRMIASVLAGWLLLLAAGPAGAEAALTDGTPPQTTPPQTTPPQTTPPQATPPQATPPQTGQPAPREAVSRGDITTVLGRQVWGEDGHAIGRIVDVLVDGAGAGRAAVVDAGGFMGLGQRRVAIAWSALHFTPGSDKITLNLKEDQVAAMPEYKPAGTGPVVVASPNAAVPPASTALPAPTASPTSTAPPTSTAK